MRIQNKKATRNVIWGYLQNAQRSNPKLQWSALFLAEILMDQHTPERASIRDLSLWPSKSFWTLQTEFLLSVSRIQIAR